MRVWRNRPRLRLATRRTDSTGGSACSRASSFAFRGRRPFAGRAEVPHAGERFDECTGGGLDPSLLQPVGIRFRRTGCAGASQRRPLLASAERESTWSRKANRSRPLGNRRTRAYSIPRHGVDTGRTMARCPVHGGQRTAVPVRGSLFRTAPHSCFRRFAAKPDSSGRPGVSCRRRPARALRADETASSSKWKAPSPAHPSHPRGICARMDGRL
jgi:hypothetical protein